MKVPFSKENVKQEPIPQNIFLTTDILFVQDAVNFIAQVERQGWTVRYVLFAGTAKVSTLDIAQQRSQPVYIVIICKVFNEGDEIINPVLNNPKMI